MARQELCLPDVGEGLTEATILGWSVGPGEVVEVNQILVEVETAKAAVELPSPFAGTVARLHAVPGETVAVGSPIISVETETEPEPALLVGYGPRPETGRECRTAPEPEPAPPRTLVRPAAKPPVRKLAKQLGVDLTAVTPTGPNSTITHEDVQLQAVPTPAPAIKQEADETRVPVRGIRRHTAAAMVASAFTAPHATEFITLDISETMRLRDTLSAHRDFRTVKITPLVFVARALLLSLRRTPQANASWDEPAQEIVLKHRVNLGIATATERGLVVPNIKDAHQLSLRQLAEAIAHLASTARAGRATQEHLTGGTITITNVGVFGVDTGTPILNPREAAILAVGAVRRTPWVVADPSGAERIEPRWVTQLALSFDHRLLDGQQGSQLLTDTAAILTDPGLAML